MELKKEKTYKIVRGFFVDGTGFIAQQDDEGNVVFPCRILISPNIPNIPPGAQVLVPLFPDKSILIHKHAVEKTCDTIHPDLLETYKKLLEKTSSKISLPSKSDILSLNNKSQIQ